LRLVWGMVLMFLIISGCTHYQPPVAEPVLEIPPPSRYRIDFKRRGTLVIPGFGAIERDGQFVLEPMY